MSEMDKILNYFKNVAPELIPEVRMVCAALPDLDDVFDIEQLACFLTNTPEQYRGMTIPEMYRVMHYDDGLYDEAMRQGTEDLSDIISVDTEKTAAAMAQREEIDRPVLEALKSDWEDNESFRGIHLDDKASARIAFLNAKAKRLCETESSMTVAYFAVPEKTSPNAMLCIDVHGNSLFFIDKEQLDLWESMLNISDDFGMSVTKGGVRFSFGIQNIWKKFKN